MVIIWNDCHQLSGAHNLLIFKCTLKLIVCPNQKLLLRPICSRLDREAD